MDRGERGVRLLAGALGAATGSRNRRCAGPRVNLLAYGLVALALVGALAGLYAKVRHDGVEAGRAEVTEQWTAANKKAQERRDLNRASAELTARTSAGELAAAQHKATTFEAKWRLARGKLPDSTLAGCSGSPTTNAAGPADTTPTPPAVRFSSGFLRLYDSAWTGPDGQPVFGDQPAAEVGTADPADAPTAIGPGEVLDNHAANARACSSDRRKLNSLIDQIEKLKAGWR